MRRLFFFILFLSLLASSGNQGWLKLYRLKQHERAMDAENQLLTSKNTSLRTEIDGLKDPKYLEHYIRQEIGLIRDDEMIYEAAPDLPPRLRAYPDIKINN